MKIAIIGGGASCVALLNAILSSKEYQSNHISITVFEPNKKIGPGRAYKGEGSYALLNRQAKFMSIRNDNPNDFYEWIKQKTELNVETNEFVPRSIFGQYLEEQFQGQIELSRSLDRPIRVISNAVTSIYCENKKIRTVTTTGESLKFDSVVLCIGTSEPKDIFNLSGSPSFIMDPYPIWLTCAGIRHTDSVGIIGSSLSAIDVVLGLKSQNHKGPLSLFSRKGVLPAVRSKHKEIKLKLLTKENLMNEFSKRSFSKENVIKLIKDEFEQQDIPFHKIRDEFNFQETVLNRLRRQLNELKENEWQPLFIKIVHECIDLLWQYSSAEDKKFFLQHYHTSFMSLCNPMPPHTALSIERFLTDKSLKLTSGIEGIEPHPQGGFNILTALGTTHVDWVINASRPERLSVSRLGLPLIQSLVGAGDAQLNPYGGIKIDPSTLKVLKRNNSSHENLYAIGQLTSGDYYYTGSLSVIKRQVEKLLPHLIKCESTSEEAFLV